MAAEVSRGTKFDDHRLLIMGHILSGYGDISATVKLLEVIKKYAPLENLALAFSGGARSYEKLKPFFELLDRVKIISFSYSDDCYDEIERFNPSAAVLFNGRFLINRTYEMIIEHSKKTPIRIPAINFNEYNNYFDEFKDNPNATLELIGVSYSLGIHSTRFNPNPSKFCLGIFQDQNLLEYYQDPNSKNSSLRLKKYTTALNPNLYQAVIGDGTVESFDKKTSLYFGYANSYYKTNFQIAFIGSAVLQTRASQKNIVIILPGLFEVNSISNSFFKFIQNENFISFKNVLWDEMTSQKKINIKQKFDNCSDNKEMNRRMTILSGHFSHQHFKDLMLASEREVLCTGDQSLGEALTAGKKIYFEAPSHKLNLSNSLSDLIRRMCGVSVSFHESLSLIKDDAIESGFYHMKNHFDSIDNHWDSFIEHIHQKQNCEKRVIGALKRFFIKIQNNSFLEENN